MAYIYRSCSIPFWAYGVPHPEEPCCLHEVGMRVDVGAFVASPTGASISDTMYALQEKMRPFLQESWAQRLLIGQGDARARTYARAHASGLPRSYVQLPCPLTADALATYLLQRIISSLRPHAKLDIRCLKVSLDPGGSYEAALGERGAARTVGCQTPQANPQPIHARQTTRFPLRSPSQRKVGDKN